LLVIRDSKGKIVWNNESIRQLRDTLRLTQQELADKLGTRQQTISEWETGMYQPRGTSAKLLSIIAEQNHFKYKAGQIIKPK
jgi:DNA-binding transcriptional regulator YiaG